MKQFFWIVYISILLSSCTAFKSATLGDDLYTVHDRIEIANKQQAEAEAMRAAAEARRAAWEAKLAEARALAAENEMKGIVSTVPQQQVNPYDAILADDYQSAYARRLNGFSSPTYKMPSSYYTYRYTDEYQYATAYDPAFYNIMVSGDQVWVEPKYITSMFGSWGAAIAVPTYGCYYGWSAPSYNWWYGYPRYSWYDWGWNSYYNPYWGWNWGFGWGGYPYHPGFIPPHHHHHYYPPHYGVGHGGSRQTIARRPNNSQAGGRPSYISGGANPNGSQQGVGSGRTQQRGSGTVTGSGQYRGSSSRTSSSPSQYRESSTRSESNSSFNQRNDNNSFRNSSPTTSRPSSYSGGSNFSGGSHGGGQIRR